MLKVCGVSFDHTINYGSCLQAYALQRVVGQMKIDGEACEYAMLTSSKIRKSKSKNQRGKSIKSFLWSRGYKLLYNYRRRQFANFEKKYMNYVDCDNRSELLKINNQYDAFICGSDVIWNFSYTNGDGLYFLDFAEKYKFSYATSLGRTDLNYDDENELFTAPADSIYKRYIPQLNDISVREEYAKSLIELYTDKNIEVTCDPTLLLSKEEWIAITDSWKPNKKYIFAYSTNTRSNYLKFLDKLKKQTGLPVIQVTWLPTDAIKQHSLFFPTPQRWLTLIKNAEYVVTSSFHGTAFSVIFQKTFFTAIEGERQVRGNVRLYDFLTDLKLEEQLYSNTPDEINLKAPDFSFANIRLAEEKKISVNYLQRNLQAAQRRKIP